MLKSLLCHLLPQKILYLEFGDCCLDISKAEKRLIRASLKTYEKTGTYVSLKLVKKDDDEYEFQQRISLTTDEFDNLLKKASKIREAFPVKDSETKKQKTDSPSPAKKSKINLN